MINIFNAINKLFKSRDKPKNVTVGSAYNFLFGGSTAGKMVTERSSMQMTADSRCIYINTRTAAARIRQWTIRCIFCCMTSLIQK